MKAFQYLIKIKHSVIVYADTDDEAMDKVADAVPFSPELEIIEKLPMPVDPQPAE
jgi:hypothetical protein